jgi:CheY-like chemotaxis protein
MSELPQTTTNRKTILVVDDIPLMRTMLAKYVKSLGLRILKEEMGITSIQVLEAENGRIALEKLQTQEVDLVFLDLMMPDTDGLTFLDIKRQNSEIAHVPVIVCSALGEKATVDRARELGAASYIVKPFSLKAVEEKLRETLSVLQG